MSSSNNGKIEQLRVLQLGMHERSAGGGVDHFFWDLFDHLAASPDLSLSAFFFRHRTAIVEERTGEFCLGSTNLSGTQRLWKLRRAVLTRLADKSAVTSTVVVSHFALYASALLPQLARLNHVVHFQGPWAIESATEGNSGLNVRLKRLIERAVYSSANAFITLSHSFRDLLIAEYRVDPTRVHVIPPAVDLQRFALGDRREARERLGWPQDATILLCVRRLARRMGLETLIEAFKLVADAHPGSLLFLGGTGALRDELVAKIESHGLTGRVRLLGFIPHDRLATAYQAADLSIMPSQSLEGFGLTTLESLATGTPVLVTPVGGLPEGVSSLDPKLVLRDKNSAALAEWVDLFLSRKLSLPGPEECRKHVEINFAWPLIAQRVKGLYSQVANE
jgi:glycosyltransferase involved in cell wall biosynthesis